MYVTFDRHCHGSSADLASVPLSLDAAAREDVCYRPNYRFYGWLGSMLWKVNTVFV
jgi:hypothetical protein